jgi:hypothetical protein
LIQVTSAKHTHSHSGILNPMLVEIHTKIRDLVRTAQFPPALRTSMPHFAASGCVHATIPLVLWTTLRRLTNLAKAAALGGKRDGVVSGIAFFPFLSPINLSLVRAVTCCGVMPLVDENAG